MIFFVAKMLLCICNSFKETFSKPKEIIELSNPNVDKKDILIKKLEKIEDTYYYSYFSQGEYIDLTNSLVYEVYYVPDYVQKFYFDDAAELKLHSEKEVAIGNNEAIVSSVIYPFLEQNKEGKRYIDIPVTYQDDSITYKRYYVRDYFKDEKNEQLYVDESENLQGNVTIWHTQSSWC